MPNSKRIERLAREQADDVPDQEHAEADQQDEAAARSRSRSSDCVSCVRCGPLPATICRRGRQDLGVARLAGRDRLFVQCAQWRDCLFIGVMSFHFFSAKAYRCFSVRTYSVSSAIAGVAAVRSPSFGFLATTTGLSRPGFQHGHGAVQGREVDVPVGRHRRGVVLAVRGGPLRGRPPCPSSRRRR